MHNALRTAVSDWLAKQCHDRCGSLCGYMCDCPGCPGSVDLESEEALVDLLAWRVDKVLRELAQH